MYHQRKIEYTLEYLGKWYFRKQSDPPYSASWVISCNKTPYVGVFGG